MTQKLAQRGRLRPEMKVRLGDGPWQSAGEFQELSFPAADETPATPIVGPQAYCPSCRETLPLNAAACSACGYSFSAAPVPAATSPWQAYLLMGAALMWLVGGLAIAGQMETSAGLFRSAAMWVAIGGFSLFFLAGAVVWALAKGHSWSTGVLFAFLGPIGLLLLALIPNRTKVR